MHDHEFQQHYPTYRLSGNKFDIVMKEYELAGKVLDTDERLFSQSTALLVIVSSIFIGILSNLEKLNSFYWNGLHNTADIYFVIFIFVSILSSLGISGPRDSFNRNFGSTRLI